MSLAASSLGEEVELVESYLGEGDYKPLECLGESLKRMAQVDYIILARGWATARGCQIEYLCAIEYGVDVLLREGPGEPIFVETPVCFK